MPGFKFDLGRASPSAIVSVSASFLPLELELTENAAITDLPRARTILGELRSLGVRLAIDVFGTGNSSLAYFRTLPLDRLKIDRSFVTHMAENEGDPAVVAPLLSRLRSGPGGDQSAPCPGCRRRVPSP